jgi:hypothetical protein
MWSSLTERSAWAAMGVLLVASAAVSCTVFDDLVVNEAAASAGGTSAGVGGQPDGGAGGAPGGAAGAGGGQPTVGYLSVPRAATLCARVFTCEQVGPSIRASTGLPIDRAASFSHCVTWLAGPSPSDRHTPAQVEMLERMALAPGCDARKEAWVEKLDDAAALCEGHSDRRCSTTENEVIDCSSRKLIERCDNALLGADTECMGASGSIACATGTCRWIDIGGHCVGADDLNYCRGDLWEKAGCGERGLLCHKESLECRDEMGVDQGCENAGETQCDGEVAKVCTEGIGTSGGAPGNKVKSPFDCATLGAGTTCQEEPAIHCEPLAPGCSLMSPDECIDGKHIQLCVGGMPTKVDCGEIDMDLECLPDAPARCGTPIVP